MKFEKDATTDDANARYLAVEPIHYKTEKGGEWVTVPANQSVVDCCQEDLTDGIKRGIIRKI